MALANGFQLGFLETVIDFLAAAGRGYLPQAKMAAVAAAAGGGYPPPIFCSVFIQFLKS